MILTKKQLVIFGVTGLIVFVALAVGLGLYFGLETEKLESAYYGGVVSNGYECAPIGSSILDRGGSAVDAAIAALFCEGIAMPQSMGIGGGFFMTIYIRETKSVITLNARETAPLDAHEDMYGTDSSKAAKGGLSIAVPGEVRGYWEAHQRYGKLPWAELVEPTIQLCRNGHMVTAYLATMFSRQEAQIRRDPGLTEDFINPTTNKTYQEGELVKRLKLADTLELIANQGPDVLYDGPLTANFIKDITDAGGIIKAEDLRNYKPIWEEPIIAKLPNDQTMYTTPLPGSGIILAFMLNILGGFLDHTNLNTATNWQRIIESFKYAYAKRTELGDAAFVPDIQNLINELTSSTYAVGLRGLISDTVTYSDPAHYGANVTIREDHGTAHVSILAPNGDAVSATSTINQYFGSGIKSLSTGIILNDEMDDFSAPGFENSFGIPPSPSNFIVPGKRPLSSMCPSIVVDGNGDVVLVIGAAGSTKITTSVALVTMRHLWFNEPLESAVTAYRLHHQLFPMQIDYEQEFNQDVIRGLAAIGHVTTAVSSDGYSALTAVSNKNNQVEASADWRRKGRVTLVRRPPIWANVHTRFSRH